MLGMKCKDKFVVRMPLPFCLSWVYAEFTRDGTTNRPHNTAHLYRALTPGFSTMQDFLTYAIDAIALSAAIYFSAMFVLGLQCRQVKPPSDVPLGVNARLLAVESNLEQLFPELPPAPEAVLGSAVALPEAADCAHDPNPLWQALTPHELRQTCQRSGIKWRNAKGKNKHLSKAEMVAALEAVPRSA
jgi:hypothetical protein